MQVIPKFTFSFHCKFSDHFNKRVLWVECSRIKSSRPKNKLLRIIVHTEIMILIFVGLCSWSISVPRGFSFNGVPGCKKLDNLIRAIYWVYHIPERCCSSCPSLPSWKVIWTKYRKPSFLFMFSVFDDPDVFSMLQLEDLMWIDLHFEMKQMKLGLVT